MQNNSINKWSVLLRVVVDLADTFTGVELPEGNVPSCCVWLHHMHISDDDLSELFDLRRLEVFLSVKLQQAHAVYKILRSSDR